jgi:hypothetical protein
MLAESASGDRCMENEAYLRNAWGFDGVDCILKYSDSTRANFTITADSQSKPCAAGSDFWDKPSKPEFHSDDEEREADHTDDRPVTYPSLLYFARQGGRLARYYLSRIER